MLGMIVSTQHLLLLILSISSSDSYYPHFTSEEEDQILYIMHYILKQESKDFSD